jgi:hypothetical protein
MKNLLVLIFIFSFFTKQTTAQNRTDMTYLNTGTKRYFIPPPTGPGTGVCEITLFIKKGKLIAKETCGGHDENGRTEHTSTLFRTVFRKNYKYEVAALVKSGDGASFGCVYFEFKDDKLYLYDENQIILTEWFCIYGNTEQDMRNEDSCDCIFLEYNGE